MKPLTPRNLWNHETFDTAKPMKPWNNCHHEAYETMKPMNLWNQKPLTAPISHDSVTISFRVTFFHFLSLSFFHFLSVSLSFRVTFFPMTPWNYWHHETYETTKQMKARNHWHRETYETMKLLTPRNLWNHDIWHRHWHILISINSCIVTPSNNPVHRPWGGVVLVFTELVALAKMKVNFCKLKTSLRRNFVYNLQTFLRFF